MARNFKIFNNFFKEKIPSCKTDTERELMFRLLMEEYIKLEKIKDNIVKSFNLDSRYIYENTPFRVILNNANKNYDEVKENKLGELSEIINPSVDANVLRELKQDFNDGKLNDYIVENPLKNNPHIKLEYSLSDSTQSTNKVSTPILDGIIDSFSKYAWAFKNNDVNASENMIKWLEDLSNELNNIYDEIPVANEEMKHILNNNIDIEPYFINSFLKFDNNSSIIIKIKNILDEKINEDENINEIKKLIPKAKELLPYCNRSIYTDDAIPSDEIVKQILQENGVNEKSGFPSIETIKTNVYNCIWNSMDMTEEDEIPENHIKFEECYGTTTYITPITRRNFFDKDTTDFNLYVDFDSQYLKLELEDDNNFLLDIYNTLNQKDGIDELIYKYNGLIYISLGDYTDSDYPEDTLTYLQDWIKKMESCKLYIDTFDSLTSQNELYNLTKEEVEDLIQFKHEEEDYEEI